MLKVTVKVWGEIHLVSPEKEKERICKKERFL